MVPDTNLFSSILEYESILDSLRYWSLGHCCWIEDTSTYLNFSRLNNKSGFYHAINKTIYRPLCRYHLMVPSTDCVLADPKIYKDLSTYYLQGMTVLKNDF